jgi:hypothetical protein
MKKEVLTKLIEKYHLAGNVESVKLDSKGGSLETTFVSDDQNVVGTVSAKNVGIEDSELGIFTTSQLVKMLGALEEEVDIKLNKVSDKCTSINFKDKDTDVSFMLADLSVIKKAPVLKSLPDFGIKIKLTKEFIEKFIKAKNALPDSDNFAVYSNGSGTKIILNYSTINSNRITFDTVTEKTMDTKAITFSAKLFKEILSVNKNCESGTLEVSDKGIAKVEFKEGNYSSVYYLVQLQHS